MSVQYSFEGGVERVELEDDSIPGFFSSETWDLFFYPDASGTYSYQRDIERSYVCRSEDGVQKGNNSVAIKGAGSGSNEVKVHFVFEDGQLTAFTIIERKGLKIEIPVTGKETRTDCPKRNRVTDAIEQQSPIIVFEVSSTDSHTFETPFVPTEQVIFSTRTPTQLEGSASGLRQAVLGDSIVLVPYTWKFSLRRRPE